MDIKYKMYKINKIYNTNYQLLVIFDKDKSNITPQNIKQEYNISKTVLLRTILINEIESVESFNQYINEKYIYICECVRVCVA